MKILILCESKTFDLIQLNLSLQLLTHKFGQPSLEYHLLFLDSPPELIEPLVFSESNWTSVNSLKYKNIKRIRAEIVPKTFDLLILMKRNSIKNSIARILKYKNKIKFRNIKELQNRFDLKTIQPKLDLYLNSQGVKNSQKLIYWIFNSSFAVQFEQSKFVLVKYKDSLFSPRKRLSKLAQILQSISKFSRLKVVLILEKSSSKRKNYLTTLTKDWGTEKLIMNLADNNDLNSLFFLSRQASLVFVNHKVHDKILTTLGIEYFNLNKKRVSNTFSARALFISPNEREKRIDRINYYIKQKIQ